MPNLVVFSSWEDEIQQRPYLINNVAQVLVESGWSVKFCNSLDNLPPANLAWLHVDLTVIPDIYRDLQKHYPIVLNGNTFDISKRNISNLQVTEGDSYQGKVIVKTNLNSLGAPEQRVKTLNQNIVYRLIDRVGARMRRVFKTPYVKAHDIAKNYTIFDNVSLVPPIFFRHPEFIVERYLEERYKDYFAVRQWLFFGDHYSHKVVYGENPVVRPWNKVDTEEIGDVPEDLQALRNKLGFDYGKFDYIFHEGSSYLIDANRTPWGGDLVDKAARNYAEILSPGINQYL